MTGSVAAGFGIGFAIDSAISGTLAGTLVGAAVATFVVARSSGGISSRRTEEGDDAMAGRATSLTEDRDLAG